jgi:hypothetical protein
MLYHTAFNKSPHEIALFKIILERLVEWGNEKDDDDDDEEDNDEGDSTSNERRASKAKKNTSPVTGCTGSLSIMDMLSLRSELTEAHEGKLTLQQTQGAIDKFIQEKWLAPEIGSKQDINSDSRSSSASTSSAEDYESTTATSYQIGPRAYMDLDMLLRDLGLRNLPQFISLVATLQPLWPKVHRCSHSACWLERYWVWNNQLVLQSWTHPEQYCSRYLLGCWLRCAHKLFNWDRNNCKINLL